jgi:hypothetical protein
MVFAEAKHTACAFSPWAMPALHHHETKYDMLLAYIQRHPPCTTPRSQNGKKQGVKQLKKGL